MVADRICKHLTDLELLKEALIDTEDEEGKTECKDEKKNMVDKHKGGPVLPKFMLSFRDFEDTIRSFNSDDEYPVEKWLSDFEDNSTLFGRPLPNRPVQLGKVQCGVGPYDASIETRQTM